MCKFITLFALTIISTAISCNKPEVKTQEPNKEKADFLIYGVDSISHFELNPSFSVSGVSPIMIKYVSGEKENVNLSTADVPAGMRIYFINQAENEITNTTMDTWLGLAFESNGGVIAGNYYAKIIATSVSGVVRKDSIKVVVHP